MLWKNTINVIWSEPNVTCTQVNLYHHSVLESCLIFSTLRSVLSGIAGALRTDYQAFVLTNDAVVSLCEGELRDLGYFQ